MNIRASAHPRKSAPCLGCASDAQPSEPGLCTVNAFMTACLLFALDPKQVVIYIGSLCDAHRAVAARSLAIMAEKNAIPVAELNAKLEQDVRAAGHVHVSEVPPHEREPERPDGGLLRRVPRLDGNAEGESMSIPSRLERTHGRFVAVWGVDHVTGPFCQVWLAPIDHQEEALIVVDNQGVRPSPGDPRGLAASLTSLKDIAELLEPDAAERVFRWLRETTRRFEVSRKVGNPYPNIDHHTVTRLFRLFGFPESIGREVWKAFD